MVKRKRLGIRFDIAYKTATGAVIYFMNIINALQVLPDEEKPEVFAFLSPDAPDDLIKAIDYPYLNILPIKYLPKWQRALNRVYRKLVNGKKFNLFNAGTYTGEPLDGVLSLVIPSEDINTKRQLLWLADLQIYHLPENFTPEEIKTNHDLKVKIIKGQHDIVLCSQWCVDDFNRIFPEHHSRMHRLRFATHHQDFSQLDPAAIKTKYGITQRYFIVSNQFWIHKNHMAVLKAVHALKKDHPGILVMITGHQKVSSPKSKGYVEGLYDYIAANGLEQNIQFLGLIPREDQLYLMDKSIAIIQPSFFESWNTTVEDAKSLGKYIILSNR
jgi:glycosyltransferase involved in cell wall biosynthesis